MKIWRRCERTSSTVESALEASGIYVSEETYYVDGTQGVCKFGRYVW